MRLTSAIVAGIVVSIGLTAGARAQCGVAAAKLTVHVIGRVQHPGTFQLDAGARLSDALTAAGADVEQLVARVGGAPVPDTECALGGPGLRIVYLVRTAESSKQIGYAVDISLARRQHDVRYDPLLRENDRIFVPDCRRAGKFIPTPPMVPTPLKG